MSMLLEKKEYTESYKTEMYFFKDVDYRTLDNFQASDLSLMEGEKANGYKPLTNSPKVINTEYLNQQIAVIDTIIKEEYYNNWSRIVGDMVTNYQGISSITNQIGETERERKKFLIESVQYMGLDLAALQQKRQTLVGLLGGQPRNIALNELGLLSSGYVYTSIQPVEKALSESMLPYINTTFLKTASKVDQQSEGLLKVVNNDHIYVAFSMPSDMAIMGEAEVEALKTELMGTTDSGINQDYYEFLIKRVDQLYYFPKLRFKFDDQVYSGYFVDVIDEGGQKIVVLMLKDYVNDFAKVVIGKSDVFIQDYSAYEIPKSAVYTIGDETLIDTVTKGYFSDSFPVVVEKYNNGYAVLRTDENPNLSSGMRISIYP
ncbi:Uncharacterised protein [Acetobacterium wieringae]|uniref:HlyD family secretion protein n=2 Tax=Acetobacterium wieringae TaxID=52694 RepID=A0A1F2PIY6_9FIRM|nr:hypothetical protein [Acetobacterium wieringae]OFV70686.1 HlyD family secretion protein [Acetobacterium wieringae]VUZ28684.1 Uncharacterised protein [Acetobacterium wieringae]